MAQIFDRSSNALARAEPGLDGVDCDRPGSDAGSTAKVAVGYAAGTAGRSAGPVQPQASRAGSGPAVPVLSYLGREVGLCGHSATRPA